MPKPPSKLSHRARKGLPFNNISKILEPRKIPTTNHDQAKNSAVQAVCVAKPVAKENERYPSPLQD
jgi:hypothetical protein